MKKVVLLCLVLLCLACKTEKDDLIGLCNDPIELSQKNVNFSSEENSVKITTNREGWWFGGISLDEKNIDIEERQKDYFKINKEVFTIEKIKSTEFVVTMKKNETDKERILSLVIQSGNCFSYLVVTQSAKK